MAPQTLEEASVLSKPLHICILTQQIGQVVSGVGLHARNLAARLVADGHRVCVVAPHDQRPPGELPYEFVGVPAPRFRDTQARWLSLSRSFARALAALQRRKVFDIVYFTDARESLFCRSNAPLVGTVNDTYAAEVRSLVYYRRHYEDWLLRWGYYRFVHICEHLALPRLQAVIANSQHTASVVAAVYPIRSDRLHLCYQQCIEPERYAPARALRASIRPHPPRVIFVGGNMQRKGLPTLIRAAPRVLATLPETEFWVVGHDKAIPHMQALCRAAGVERHVRFWGLLSHNQLLQLYAQADVFAMPSLTEAFGAVFLEAMAAGVVALGTRVGGIPEIIEDGVNGVLVAPDDPETFGQELVRVLGDRQLRDQLCQEGLATARRFDLERMMRCNYDVYCKLLRRSS
jgi:glycosyltransferase involved in cell wall biosynthesis